MANGAPGKSLVYFRGFYVPKSQNGGYISVEVGRPEYFTIVEIKRALGIPCALVAGLHIVCAEAIV